MSTVLSRRRSRPRPLIIILLLVSITLVVIDQTGDAAPTGYLRSGVRDATASVTGSLDRLNPLGDNADVKALQKENQQLRTQLDVAQGQLAQTGDAVRERDALKKLLALPTLDDITKVVANVTSVGASNYDATMELGKGSNSGIRVGMPVVNDKGLIGRVVEVSKQRSTVLLIVDTTASTGVRFATGDIAVATGNGLGKSLRVDLIDITSTIKPGDIAVTSGGDHSVYPPGVPVGAVSSLNAGPQSLRKDVDIAPLVDAKTLTDVAVLMWTP